MMFGRLGALNVVSLYDTFSFWWGYWDANPQLEEDLCPVSSDSGFISWSHFVLPAPTQFLLFLASG